jgi:hypothetical protein
MHERARNLDALAHALRIGGDLSVLCILQRHELDRASHSGADVGQPIELGAGANEFLTRQKGMDGLPLGNEAEDAIDVWMSGDGRAIAKHLAG